MNQFGLRFDSKNMYDDLIMEFIKALDHVSNQLLYQMKDRAKMENVSSSIKKELMWVAFHQVEIMVGSDLWQAFLDNYGTGSKMASQSQNPYLSEYKRKYWHDARTNNAVTGRKSGSYETLDWENGSNTPITRESKGNLKGVNLETLDSNKSGIKFIPQSPSFFIENAMQFIEKIFIDEIQNVYEHFPFHKYIHGEC